LAKQKRRKRTATAHRRKRRAVPKNARVQVPQPAHKQERKIGTMIKHTVYFALILIAVVFAFSLVPSILSYSVIDTLTFEFMSYAALSLSFPASVIIYLRFIDKSEKGIAERLGLGAKSFSALNLLIGVLIFLVIFVLELVVGGISYATGVQINTNVVSVFAGAPLWFYIFSCLIAPINEEVLFRGLAVPRLGIVVSAVIFGLLHSSYDSTFGVEVMAAAIFGIVAGYAFRKTDSLYPSIVAHILVNTLTLLSIVSVMSL
jgi:membrane protease YdiL (CAAX protease family)